jgi:hypothetical protein
MVQVNLLNIIKLKIWTILGQLWIRLQLLVTYIGYIEATMGEGSSSSGSGTTARCIIITRLRTCIFIRLQWSLSIMFFPLATMKHGQIASLVTQILSHHIMTFVLFLWKHVFSECLTWLITYFQCTCNSPMESYCLCNTKQGTLNNVFALCCYDSNTLLITMISHYAVVT